MQFLKHTVESFGSSISKDNVIVDPKERHGNPERFNFIKRNVLWKVPGTSATLQKVHKELRRYINDILSLNVQKK